MKKTIATILCAVLVVITFPVNSISAEEGESEETPVLESEYTYTGLGNKVMRRDEELTQKYEQGITMEPEQIEARQKRVQELGLEEHVDERFFLEKEYYSQYSINELEQKGLTLLVECMTEEEIAAWESRLESGIAPMYITRGNDLISWTNSAGITTRTYAFDVDGHVAFCGDHGLTAPATGTNHSEYKAVTNAELNKLLYYGYCGPDDQMTKLGYSKAKSYIIMAMSVSNLRHGRELGADGRIFWEAIKDLKEPSSGCGYYVETYETELQDLFFYVEPQNGKLKIVKKSGNTVLISGNDCYSLAGAEYGVYTNPDGVSGLVGTLVTDSQGNTQELELSEGTYYLREIKAPPGFALDQTVYTATVQAGNTTSADRTDQPQRNPLGILLEKVDAETNTGVPQGSATLKGAEFTVKYYPGLWNKGVDPASLGKTPSRKWVFATDQNGIVNYDSQYKVSGDELFMDGQETCLPLGTVTIQETKASEGYLINHIVHTIQINSEGTEQNVSTYNKSIIPENIFKLNLIKKQEGTEIVIPGAVFEHTKPDLTTELLTTDAKGSFTIKGLQRGTHKLRETSVMDGYEINGNVIEFTVAEDNKVTLLSHADPLKGNVQFEVTEEGNIQIVMEDKLSPFALSIHKENQKKQKLSGAEFTLFAEQECTTKLMSQATDTDGILKFAGLEIGKKYYLKETKAPAGYRIPVNIFGQPIVYEIYTESIPAQDRFIFYVDGKAYDANSDPDGQFSVTGTKSDREANVKVENRTGRLLPTTGSNGMLKILSVGTALLVAAVIGLKKGNDNKRRKSL